MRTESLAGAPVSTPPMSFMRMSPTLRIPPVLLTALLISAMSASSSRPHQLGCLQPLLFPLASPWTCPLKKLSQCLAPWDPSTAPLLLDPNSPRGPRPSTVSPGVAFAGSQLRVVPGPSSLCCCPGYSTMPCTLCSPFVINHPACSLLLPMPSPVVPAGGSMEQTDSRNPFYHQLIPAPSSF